MLLLTKQSHDFGYERKTKFKNIKIPLNYFKNKLSAHGINVINVVIVINSEQVQNSDGTEAIHDRNIFIKTVNLI